MGKEKRHHVPPVLIQRARDLRHQQVPAEAKVWACLRARQLGGFKLRRQVPLLDYIADFSCAECRLVIDLDGDSHFGNGREQYDNRQTRRLEEDGHRVLRFTNLDVDDNLGTVLEMILDACLHRQVAPSPQPSPTRGEGEMR